MSILTDLLERKITFGQAAQEAAAWASSLISHDPVLSSTASAVLSDVKQGASNAVDMADTAIGVAIVPAAKAAEAALDAALSSVTKGASVAFNPFVNDGIDRMAAAIKAEADAWALKVKAQLADPAGKQNQ